MLINNTIESIQSQWKVDNWRSESVPINVERKASTSWTDVTIKNRWWSGWKKGSMSHCHNRRTRMTAAAAALTVSEWVTSFPDPTLRRFVHLSSGFHRHLGVFVVQWPLSKSPSFFLSPIRSLQYNCLPVSWHLVNKVRILDGALPRCWSLSLLSSILSRACYHNIHYNLCDSGFTSASLN